MLVGNLIKSIKFPFLEAQRFMILEVRRLASQVHPHPNEVEQHRCKFVSSPFLKIQSKYDAARNQ